ncbi:hypothetical protein M3226_24350 [Neobacillus cucumis]|uniref:hypothetical protein n=1 Tax=Neobacillus cucumis TaxID=1740721 RepID=UPI00203D51D8|nr:hypothetical protein [Neobacillus cucumis]MCM3728779.1 hypothetical protein [Neobacillus cucumis]
MLNALSILIAPTNYTDAKVIEEYWHMAQIIAYGYQLDHEMDQIVNLAIQSFKQLIRKLK